MQLLTVGKLAAGIAGTTGAVGVGFLVEWLAQIATPPAGFSGLGMVMAGLLVVTALVGACRFPGQGMARIARSRNAASGEIFKTAVSAQRAEAPTAAAELLIIQMPYPSWYRLQPSRKNERKKLLSRKVFMMIPVPCKTKVPPATMARMGNLSLTGKY